ncbi:uncharacterized protein EV420DRAFT_502290 [Desarmillaria tabescens]|uniref:Coenzyme Q-binding protein COQ10 START domain-containing protein n=1 Tax=Armillaria tabescens TaxID=1929756 RepID=A0AA39KEX8_ARMTA|nr:uncharacterized protein EV420DRAFT_502290 [Desarmillaria tabescens]KAK0457543.1 hypothetical protein EV420DRAFT_502290 [Desarmillaria tabescens]
MLRRNLLTLILYSLVPFVASQSSNIPSNLPETTGEVNISGSSLINAPKDAVWDAVLDFSAYPDWNPFVRSQLVANEFAIPLKNQTAFVGAKLIITSQIPPLPQPVDASTAPNLLTQHITIEEITVIDIENYRVAWVLVSPDWILKTIRRSAVSTVIDSDGVEKSYYESRETFNGPLATAVNDLVGDDLAKSFQAQADALKVWMEA